MPLYAPGAASVPLNFSPDYPTLSVNDIALRVKRQFGDEAGVQITNDDIFRWINDAQREIAKRNDLLQTVATTDIVSADGTYIHPSDILQIRSVHYDGRKLQPMSPQEAEEYIASNDTTAGEPQTYWIWANKINLYPIPQRNITGGLKIFYTRQPREVLTLSDIPELNVRHHNRIVEYALQQAYELDENWNAAQLKAKQFKDGMDEDRGSEHLNSDFYPTITVRPEDL